MSGLVDQFGSPIPTRLLNGADRWSEKRPYWPVRNEGFVEAIDLWDWKTVLSVSRRLYANNGIVKGAISQKAMHSIGNAWEPQFQGADKEWGAMATEWLRNEWFPVCDVRGETHDFKTGLYLDSVCIDRDGDNGILLTETEDGWPQIQRISAHQVGQRDGKEKVVASGSYRGLSISHGVITNRQGRAVAFRLLGPTPDDDREVSARDFDFRFEPEYADQLRGLPIFSHALNDIRDADQSQDWEQLAQLAMSSIILTEHNESGLADDDTRSLLAGAAPVEGMTQERLAGGAIRYFKAGSGGKLEAVTSARPGDAWDSFQDRIARKALLGINWPYSLCWKPDSMNGTQERSEIEKARMSIADRQGLLAPRARRVVGYAISKAINLGILPEYRGADKAGFLKWDFSLPRKFSIDHGRESASRREDYKLGHSNLADILAQDGKTFDAHQEQRQMEILDVVRRAQAIAQQAAIPLETALSLFQQRQAQAYAVPTAVDNP